MMNDHSTLMTVVDFLRRQTGKQDLVADTPLISSGLVDSLLVMDIIGLIEAKFGVRMLVEDLTPYNLETAERMVAMVLRRMAVPASTSSEPTWENSNASSRP